MFFIVNYASYSKINEHHYELLHLKYWLRDYINYDRFVCLIVRLLKKSK